MKPVVVAITGASGAVYGRSLVSALLELGHEVDLVVSRAGQRVAHEELGHGYQPEALSGVFGPGSERVRLHPVEDIGARIASGSFPVQGMVVIPCSVGTAGRIAAGLSSNLIERAADVQLKERRPLVLTVRETPLSTLHLAHLLELSRAGATILPAAPGFYARPQRIEELVRFITERTLAALGLEAPRHVEWQGGTS